MRSPSGVRSDAFEPPAVRVRVISGEARASEARFDGTFVIGRSEECDVQVLDGSVSRQHLQVLLDAEGWWLKDLDTVNGTWLDGGRISRIRLEDRAQVELGEGGPTLSLSVERGDDPRAEVPTVTTERVSSETQLLRRFMRPAGAGPVGKQTLMFRRALQRAEQRSSRKYQIAIGAALVVLALAGGVIALQARKLGALRGTAERLFYTMKTLELQATKLEELVLLRADPQQVAELSARREKLRQMEKEYDAFVQELGTYGKLPADERVILRVARAFGECDVNVPRGFVSEVQRFIGVWRSSDRLLKALQRARAKGYDRTIAKVLADHRLPPQFFYLALQESSFDERAVGPPTRYGIAKGMWQFIPLTASRYGLQVGPLHDRGAYDPLDERFHWEKETVAAARYLKDLDATETQGSGLLAMACYNWGEDNLRALVSALPQSPQQRNFWRVLADKKVPRETYDYVLAIFSAAVICEDPRLFGFDLPCPLLVVPANVGVLPGR